MFLIMLNIFKTWAILNAVQTFGEPKSHKGRLRLRWGYSDERAFKSGEMFRLCLNFYSNISFTSLEISSDAYSKL